jgi:hypothetical protein
MLQIEHKTVCSIIKKRDEGTFYDDEKRDKYVRLWKDIFESQYVNFKK